MVDFWTSAYQAIDGLTEFVNRSDENAAPPVQ